MLRINRRVLTLGAGVIVSGDEFLLTALDRHQRIPHIVRESKAGIGKGPARRIWDDNRPPLACFCRHFPLDRFDSALKRRRDMMYN